ncbi:MAG: hypothetical protein HZB14_09390 [Actinobacteria bacterium]|nr:hypothetical protein [Actinomycetota bacterium]
MSSTHSEHHARPLEDAEERILERLVAGLPEQLREIAETQTNELRVHHEENLGSSRVLYFELADADRITGFPSDGRLPIDACLTSADGVTSEVEVMLFVKGGRLAEMEVFRSDGEPLEFIPAAELLKVWSPDSLS